MGVLRATLFMSLDGVVEAPEVWHFPYYSDEMRRDLAEALDPTDAMILGRVTYEEFAAYWPHQPADGPFVEYNNEIHKFVVSTTLERAGWNNSEIISKDVAQTLQALKQDLAGDMNVTGSATLVRWMLANGILDELHLQISPVLVGKGRRLFDTSTTAASLELLRSKPLPHGVISLVYKTSKD